MNLSLSLSLSRSRRGTGGRSLRARFRYRAVRRPEPPACDITPEELFNAYYDCRVRKRNSDNALAFERRLERNLMDLYHELHGAQRNGVTSLKRCWSDNDLAVHLGAVGATSIFDRP